MPPELLWRKSLAPVQPRPVPRDRREILVRRGTLAPPVLRVPLVRRDRRATPARPVHRAAREPPARPAHKVGRVTPALPARSELLDRKEPRVTPVLPGPRAARETPVPRVPLVRKARKVTPGPWGRLANLDWLTSLMATGSLR